MPGIRRLLLLVPLLTAGLAVTGCAERWSLNGQYEKTMSAGMFAPEAVDADSLEVSTKNGSIEITPSDTGDVQIVAEIRARSKERADRTSIVAEPRGGVLFVRAEFPGGMQNNEGASFRIATPPLETIVARSSNGRIECSATVGEVDAETSNGAVVIAGTAETVRARSSNGAITLRDVTGDATARTSNGRIEVGRVGGSVVAHTSNGRITAGPVTGRVDLDTSNGSVTVLLDPSFTGSFIARNGVKKQIAWEGAKHLAAPPSVDIDTGSLSVVVGDGPASRVETSNGSITVRVVEPIE